MPPEEEVEFALVGSKGSMGARTSKPCTTHVDVQYNIFEEWEQPLATQFGSTLQFLTLFDELPGWSLLELLLEAPLRNPSGSTQP